MGSGGAAAGSGAEYDGSGWAAGDGDAGGGGAEAGAGDGFRTVGVNTDSNGTTTVGSSGDSGASGRLQAEKGGSGLDTGRNGDSGGPDGAVPDGDISRASAGAAEERSV
jgi:hypothetical protein